MSTKILHYVDPTLRSFHIFNSNLCRREGEEHNKILYYFPEDIEINSKIKDVGLVEAILGFSSIFSDTDKGCKSLHTQKTTQLFYEPEPGYWMGIAVNKAKEIRTKNGIEITEYKTADDGHDDVYRNMLQQFYNLFQLLEGKFESILKTDLPNGQILLRNKLKTFFDQHMKKLLFPINQAIGLTHSTEYLPLDKLLYLRSKNIVNIISTSFPIISDVFLYYNQRIICNKKLTPLDSFYLHGYITQIFNKETDTNDRQTDGHNIWESYKKGGVYLMGNTMTEEMQSNVIQKAKKLFLRDRYDNLFTHYLIIYNVLDVSVCLLIKSNDDKEFENLVTEDFYKDLHRIAEPYLSSLSNDIKDMLCRKVDERLSNINSKAVHYLNTSSGSSANSLTSIFTKAGTADNVDAIIPKFFFIDELNLKHISNLKAEHYFFQLNQTERTDNLPLNIMNTLADLLAQRRRPFTFEEVIVKTTNEFWIIAHYFNNRQFYVIVLNNKATLLDVSSEMKRIVDLETPFGIMFDV